MKPCYRGNDECPDDCCLPVERKPPRRMVLEDICPPFVVTGPFAQGYSRDSYSHALGIFKCDRCGNTPCPGCQPCCGSTLGRDPELLWLMFT